MGTAGRHARRSVRAVLLGSALAALLTITSVGAASGAYHSGAAGAEEAGAGTLRRTDVWMKDNAADIGVEPSTGSIYWSPDIKVCHTSAGCAVSQNPIIGFTNYIFVTLRNPGPYGSGTGTGTLFVYRSTPGGGTAWPGGWTLIGGVGATVPAGTTTVMVPWTGVPGPGHFCLLARWVSSSDPMVPEGPVTTVNAQNNNNIAWRNVDSVVLDPSSGGTEVRPFAIGNPLPASTRNDIVFTQLGGKAFREVGGQMIVDLGQVLFDRWRRGGMAGANVRQVGPTQVEILDPAKASLNNLVLGPEETLTFKILFSARTDFPEPILLNVAQFGPDGANADRTDLGGVQYQITVGQERK